MDDRSHGIQATIIDLGLSRMDAGDGSDGERVHWTPFDEEVFMGEGIKPFFDFPSLVSYAFYFRRLSIRRLSYDEGTQWKYMGWVSSHYQRAGK